MCEPFVSDLNGLIFENPAYPSKLYETGPQKIFPAKPRSAVLILTSPYSNSDIYELL